MLPEIVGDSDYINFCYIDVIINSYILYYVICIHTQGYHHPKAFLAGPGPMQSTAGDFWTMIWEKGSHTIVMLGQLTENEEVA